MIQRYYQKFKCLHIKSYKTIYVDKNWVTKTILRCRICNKEIRPTNDVGVK